jgi:hypothetical protein
MPCKVRRRQWRNINCVERTQLQTVTWVRFPLQRLLCLQFTHCFFKTNFQPYPYFLSSVLIVVRRTFLFPILLQYYFFCGVAFQPGHGLFILEVSRSHLNTPLSVGFLWMSVQLVAETTTWQHISLTTEKHSCPYWIKTQDSRKQAAADLRLRPHGRWDRRISCIHTPNNPPWIEHTNSIWSTVQITNLLIWW